MRNNADRCRHPVFWIAVALLLTVLPIAARADVKDAGMQDCRAMRQWRYLLNTETSMTPKVEQAIRRRDWAEVREEFLIFAKAPDHLDARVRRRVNRELASAELFFAAARGDLRWMRRLLEEGADADVISTSEENMSALAWAASCDHPAAVDLLIAHGARVNRSFSYFGDEGHVERSTALTEASVWGAKRALAALLAHHADPNARYIECVKWALNDDDTCKRGKLTVFNALGLAKDAEVRQMLRAAGAKGMIVGKWPPPLKPGE